MARFLLISVLLVAALVVCANATISKRCNGPNEEWKECGACDGKCGMKVNCILSCRPGSCGCKKGHVRDNHGICILERFCLKMPCGINEEIKGCGACDSTCKEDRACTLDCRSPQCGCKNGYVRNDRGICILKSLCPKMPCGENEEMKVCGACDSTCKEDKMCTKDCRPSQCGCKKGYVRDDRGVCILKGLCPEKPPCGENEEMKGCGACDSTCKETIFCTADCRPPQCGCKKDHVRDDNKKCIHKSKCPVHKL